MNAFQTSAAAWTIRVVLLTWVVSGLAIFALPETFYSLTPGVQLYGPFNSHFIRDVGLVYLATGLSGLYFLWQLNWGGLVMNLSWSFLHGLFHLHFWAYRGFPFDGIFFFDLAFVLLPTYILLTSILLLRKAWMAGAHSET